MKKVQSLTFEGEGCAISLASASIMTELVKENLEKQQRNHECFLKYDKKYFRNTIKYLDEDEKTKLCRFQELSNIQ